MLLTLTRLSVRNGSTLGALYRDGAFQCFTLELGPSPDPTGAKVPGKTRIPEGTYDVTLLTGDAKDPEYRALFPDIQIGMLHLENVPDFTGVLIHTGDTIADTLGCLLVGSCPVVGANCAWRVSASQPAYRAVYPPIANAIAGGESCQIQVVSLEADACRDAGIDTYKPEEQDNE